MGSIIPLSSFFLPILPPYYSPIPDVRPTEKIYPTYESPPAFSCTKKYLLLAPKTSERSSAIIENGMENNLLSVGAMSMMSERG